MKRITTLLAILILAAVNYAPARADYTAQRFVLNASSPVTTCTSLTTSAKAIVGIWNAGAAQTAVLSLYDEAGVPTCAAADLVYSTTVPLTAGQVIVFPLASQWLKNGLAYNLSVAATGTITILMI